MNSRFINTITGRGIPLCGHDIDTDRIIPARFLKSVSFEGLERHACEDDRKRLAERGYLARHRPAAEDFDRVRSVATNLSYISRF